MKPNINSVEVHPQSESNNGHPVDDALLGAGPPPLKHSPNNRPLVSLLPRPVILGTTQPSAITLSTILGNYEMKKKITM